MDIPKLFNESLPIIIAGITAIWVFFKDQIGSYFNSSNDRRKKILDDEITSKNQFQEKIVFQMFEAYVTQNQSVMAMFSENITKLEGELRELNRIIKDVYALVDVIRRDINHNDKKISERLTETIKNDELLISRLTDYINNMNFPPKPITLKNDNKI